MNILIVDDEKEIRDSLADLFLLIGKFSEVDIAKEGNEAINKIKEKPYDFILTDVNMPNGMDGISLVKKINEDSLNVDNIYVMSGYSQNDELVRDLDIKGYFPKPLTNIKEVISKIKNKETV